MGDLRDGGDSQSSFESTTLLAGKPDQTLTVRMRLLSTGQTHPGHINVHFYLSADTSITPSDYYLGQASAWLMAMENTVLTLEASLPVTVPPGSYYVGWIIDPENLIVEADENNNTAYKSTPLLRVVSSLATTIYVDAAARGTRDGSTWKNAFTSLQDALAAAPPGGEVHVAGGVYTPDQGVKIAPGDRGASFAIRHPVTIVGGYAGSQAPNPEVRHTQTYATILSGDLKANDLPVADPGDLWKEASRTDNSRHILTITSPDPVTLDGLHVTGGNAFGPSTTTTANSTQGAGLVLSAGSALALRDCTFSGNWASTDGGAIYAANARLELADCMFRANGAGVDAPVGSPRGTGGAICGDARSQLTLLRCQFHGNFAGVQGGALSSDKSSTVVTRCLFLQNRSGGAGGALRNSEGGLNLVNCILNGNQSGGDGGGIVNTRNGILSAANCLLHANHGGGRAGAIHNFAGGKVTMWNCTLAANRQNGGPGAIVCGPALGQAGGELTIANSILWNGGGEIANEDKSVATIARTNIQGGWPGAGNLDIDPMFVLPAGSDGKTGTGDDNLRLHANSPCLDRGSNALLPQDFADLDGDGDIREPLPLDLDGKARVTGPAVDLGAYEVPSGASSTSSSCDD